MTVSGFPSDSDRVRWEVRFGTDDAERVRAKRGYRRLKARKRGVLAVSFAILAVLVFLWLLAWLSHFIELGLSQFFSGDALWLARIAAVLTIVAVIAAIAALSRKADRQRESGETQASVRFYMNGDISFVDKDTEVKRLTESIGFDEEFVYTTIENRTRFVYIPRKVINPGQFEELMKLGS